MLLPANQFRRHFDPLGVETQVFEMPAEMGRAGHLFGRKLDGTRRRFVLIGHLDTVFEAVVCTGTDFIPVTSTNSFSTVEAATETVFSGLSDDTTYYFRVRAQNHNNIYTGWTETILSTKTVPAGTAPAAVTNLSALSGNGLTPAGQIQLSWTAPTDIAGGANPLYDLRYSTEAAITMAPTEANNSRPIHIRLIQTPPETAPRVLRAKPRRYLAR